MNEQNAGKRHAISSSMREGIKIDGVLDVVSFDERGVALETVVGSMAVEGEELFPQGGRGGDDDGGNDHHCQEDAEEGQQSAQPCAEGQ